jgi:hypothetical protein
MLEISQHTLKYEQRDSVCSGYLIWFEFVLVKMTSTTVSESAPKLVMFSGKKSDWDAWFFGFEARASMYDYIGIVTGEEKVPTKEELKDLLAKKDAEVTEAVTRSIKLNVLNGRAFSHLVSSLDISKDTAKVAINLLRWCKTDDYPQGNAKKAVDILKNYYNLKSVAMAQKDPAVFLAEMQNLHVKIEEIDKDQKMDDRDFILHILNRLPPEYDYTVAIIEMEMASKVLAIHHILDKLCPSSSTQYQSCNGKGKSKDGDGDVALYGGSAFKGKCNRCE